MADFKWVDFDGSEVDEATEEIVCADGHYLVCEADEDGGWDNAFDVGLIPLDGSPDPSPELVESVRKDFKERTMARLLDLPNHAPVIILTSWYQKNSNI